MARTLIREPTWLRRVAASASASAAAPAAARPGRPGAMGNVGSLCTRCNRCVVYAMAYTNGAPLCPVQGLEPAPDVEDC
jgi:hypothetical protein